MSDSSVYSIGFDGDTWYTTTIRDYVSVPVQQAEVIRLWCGADVIATVEHDAATGTYSITGFSPMDEDVMGDHPGQAYGWHTWTGALGWVADQLSGTDRTEIIAELGRH
jgi:hypothetical protein